MAAGGEQTATSRSLQDTPTWALATVCLIFIFLSLLIEHSIHLISHWLKRHRKTALFEAVEKLKSVLMFLGLMSLILAVTQSPISKICIPNNIAYKMLPCRKNGATKTKKALALFENFQFEPERKLAEATSTSSSSSDYCESQGKTSFISQDGIIQLNNFIVVLAIMQIVYSVVTVGFGRAKMRRWEAWEKETQTVEYQVANDPNRFRYTRQTTFARRHMNYGATTSDILMWIRCFFRQFFNSVAKVDYLTLRHGFISEKWTETKFRPHGCFKHHSWNQKRPFDGANKRPFDETNSSKPNSTQNQNTVGGNHSYYRHQTRKILKRIQKNTTQKHNRHQKWGNPRHRSVRPPPRLLHRVNRRRFHGQQRSKDLGPPRRLRSEAPQQATSTRSNTASVSATQRSVRHWKVPAKPETYPPDPPPLSLGRAHHPRKQPPSSSSSLPLQDRGQVAGDAPWLTAEPPAVNSGYQIRRRGVRSKETRETREKAHLSTNNSTFNFQKYIQRSLEDDFKVVVGISPFMWLLVVIFMLVDVHGWHVYLWVSFVPLFIVLVLGTKLEVIVAKMALKLHEKNNVIIGTPLVQPNDNLFWFGHPKYVLTLLHFTLFMNAFELAFFVWVTWQFGIKSCYHELTEIIVIRGVLVVTVQVMCSYITLPLYALVTQMGSNFKKTMLEEDTVKAIRKWHVETKEKMKKHRASPSDKDDSSSTVEHRNRTVTTSSPDSIHRRAPTFSDQLPQTDFEIVEDQYEEEVFGQNDRIEQVNSFSTMVDIERQEEELQLK